MPIAPDSFGRRRFAPLAVLSSTIPLADRRPQTCLTAASKTGILCRVASIAQNLTRVRDRIAGAVERSGRDAGDVVLVAVTKTVDAFRVREAIAAGITDIGENYVQEAQAKWLELRGSAKWHFIGHLQRNKVKAAVEFVDMVHSVDSLALAQEIGKRARAIGRRIDALVEVNVAGEAQKFGTPSDQALELANEVASVEGIRFCGFMGMTPLVEDPELTRPYFAGLRSLFDRLPPEHRLHLSMGMTQDFEVAIEEGATMVRIGTAIFGART